MSIEIYQPADVSRWRKRINGYSAMRRGLLFEDTGASFLGLSIYDDYDSGTYVAPLANPNGNSIMVGSGPKPESCCCCECRQPGGIGGTGSAVCKFGTTPPVLQFLASGITQPGCCIVIGSPGSAQGAGPDPNGTWTGSNGPSSPGGFTNCCVWASSGATGGSITFYSDDTCGTATETTNFINCVWTLNYEFIAASNTYYRQVRFSVQQNDGTASDWLVFANTTDITADLEIDCSETVTLDNQLTCGEFFRDAVDIAGGTGHFSLGTGGSVVISPA